VCLDGKVAVGARVDSGPIDKLGRQSFEINGTKDAAEHPIIRTEALSSVNAVIRGHLADGNFQKVWFSKL
jgi:hypothetical protein